MTDFNPKIHRTGANASRSTSFNFADVENPINAEIKDPDSVLKAFKRWPLIPYAGNKNGSSQGLLHFLNACKFIAPTQGACHESIKTFAFGGKIDIKFVEDEEFDLGDDREEVPLETKKRYVQFLKTVKIDTSFTQLTEALFDSYKCNGNYILEIVHTETAGLKQSSIHYHATENCAYWHDKSDVRYMAISPIWDYNYLEKNPPKIVPLYPNYKKDANGTLRTIIHVKNGNFRWFGRPDWIASWIQCYREYQDSDYMVKMAANRFTGEVFIEVEDDDIEIDDPFDGEDAVENGYENIGDRIEKNFTSKADDPQTIMVTTRPHGAKPAFVYQFKPVTNENFFKVNSDLARQKIIENNQWSERLLGNAISDGFASDAFMSELKIKEVGCLKRYRNIISYGLNLAFNEILKFQGNTEFESLGIYYKSTFDLLKDDGQSADSAKEVFDAFGVGVRAGVMTPTKEDEIFFRNLLGIGGVNSEIEESWQEDGGYRRPITLKGSEDSESEQTRNE